MKTIATLVSLMLYICANAQQLPDTLARCNTFLRFNIINLLDFSEPTLSFGAETRINPRVSLALDAGYILMSQRFREHGTSSGFVLRPAVRYFPENTKIFFECELHYKQHTHHINDWLGRDISGGVPAYQEYRQFRLRKQVMGLHLKFGTLIPITNRMWFELYVGVGPHFRKFTVVEQKDFVYNFELIYENVNTGETERLVAVPMGCKLLFRLR